MIQRQAADFYDSGIQKLVPRLNKCLDSVQEVMTWFKGQAADLYDSGIQKLVPRLNNCLDNTGDYVEK